MSQKEETVKTEEMANWPGTPGESRLKAAINLLEGRTAVEDVSGVAKEDARQLERKEEIEVFNLWAEHELGKLFQMEDITLEALIRIVNNGSSEDYIGALLSNREPGDDVAMRASKLFRLPDWVGLHPMLPEFEGKEALIIGNPQQGQGNCIIVASDRILQARSATEEAQYQGPMTDALYDVLRWHGVKKVHWLTDPDRLQHEARK